LKKKYIPYRPSPPSSVYLIQFLRRPQRNIPILRFHDLHACLIVPPIYRNRPFHSPLIATEPSELWIYIYTAFQPRSLSLSFPDRSRHIFQYQPCSLPGKHELSSSPKICLFSSLPRTNTRQHRSSRLRLNRPGKSRPWASHTHTHTHTKCPGLFVHKQIRTSASQKKKKNQKKTESTNLLVPFSLRGPNTSNCQHTDQPAVVTGPANHFSQINLSPGAQEARNQNSRSIQTRPNPLPRTRNKHHDRIGGL
jgi:hypothetical protein